jgi:hypothetical protein
MIKKLIAPLQKLLMQKKMCPACTRPLNKAKSIGTVNDGKLLVCNCGRIFVLGKDSAKYRRALDNDLKNVEQG